MPGRRLGWRRSWPRWRRSPQLRAGAELPRWLGDARTPTQPDSGSHSARTPRWAGAAGRARAGIPRRAPTPRARRLPDTGAAAGARPDPPPAPGRDHSAPRAGPRRLLLSRQGGSGGGGGATQGRKPSSRPLLPRPPSSTSSSSSCRRQHRPSRPLPPHRPHASARPLARSLPPAASSGSGARRAWAVPPRCPGGVGVGTAGLLSSRRLPETQPWASPATRPAPCGPAASAWAARSEGGPAGHRPVRLTFPEQKHATSVAQEAGCSHSRGDARVGVPRHRIRIAAASGPGVLRIWGEAAKTEVQHNQIVHSACREAYCHARKGLAVPPCQNIYSYVHIHKHSVGP